MKTKRTQFKDTDYTWVKPIWVVVAFHIPKKGNNLNEG